MQMCGILEMSSNTMCHLSTNSSRYPYLLRSQCFRHSLQYYAHAQYQGQRSAAINKMDAVSEFAHVVVKLHNLYMNMLLLFG